MQVFDKWSGKVPIKAWVDGVEFEDAAMEQTAALSQLPFLFKHVAVMPDVHAGIGSTVGTVIATRGAIIPAAVGVDIGCGMVAQRTSLTASDLPDDLHPLRNAIEEAVPHGRTAHGQRDDKGAWQGDVPHLVQDGWLDVLAIEYDEITAKHPNLKHQRAVGQLGTLGTGNHFIEICLDEEQRVWVMLHSGSRGAGNVIGTYFTELAKQDMQKYFITLPETALAYLPENTEHFDDYMKCVGWAQEYARINRQIMLNSTIWALDKVIGKQHITMDESAINCHHNYVARENHFGRNVLITRKGAVRAREGDLGIIPGSMGVCSYIVRGLGNPESFSSCSHGAGRRMSRTRARAKFNIADHIQATAGVECRKDAAVLDETPGAYKSIDAVMEAQKDLVSIEHKLKQVVCVKG